MNNNRDPVDEALRALRDDRLPCRPNPHLEDKLVSVFDKRQHGSFSLATRTMVCIFLLVVAGGVAAASGGMEKLKSWLVTVEIDGQPTTMEVGENGEQSMSVETDDRGTATVTVSTSASEQGQETSVRIEKISSDELDHDVEEVVHEVRREGSGPVPFDLADVGNTDPATQWTDEDGTGRSVYILSNDPQGSKIVLATTPSEGEPYAQLVASPPVSLVDDGMTSTVSVLDDGSISVLASDKAGEREVALRFLVQDDGAGMDAEEVSVESPDGTVRVEVNPKQ